MDNHAPAARTRIYRFGSFAFDAMRRLLFKGSQAIPVPERLALILMQLLQANGRVVSKESLAIAIWPNESVSDANLTQHIYMLRQLFGDRAKEHTHILAVPRRGYRFALPVQTSGLSFDETFTADPAELGELVSASDFEAFRFYCQGSFYLAKRTAPNLRRALEFFEKALTINPLYVPALIGLSRAYSLMGSYWYMPPNVTFPYASKAIDRVLLIEPANAVAHAVKSGSLCFADWNWERARAEIDQAIRLNPGSPLVRNNATWLDISMGRYEDALVQARLALALEPASLLNQLLVARALLHSRKYDHATAIMTSILEADDTFHVARRYRAQAYLLGGHPEKALNDLERLPQERSEDCSFRLPMLGRAFADLGDESRAHEVFDALRELARTHYVVFWNLAIVAVGIGRCEDTLAYLEMAYAQHEPTLPFLRSLPWFEPVARDDRFTKLLAKIGP
jgi:DNA-binding winged helix-turn-helix (wHTH) protein/Flp pilus assembly protein TadD